MWAEWALLEGKPGNGGLLQVTHRQPGCSGAQHVGSMAWDPQSELGEAERVGFFMELGKAFFFPLE